MGIKSPCSLEALREVKLGEHTLTPGTRIVRFHVLCCVIICANQTWSWIVVDSEYSLTTILLFIRNKFKVLVVLEISTIVYIISYILRNKVPLRRGDDK